MRLYLDLCALKRPFDDQSLERVTLETQALFSIVGRIDDRRDTMVWSTALTLENDADPDDERRLEVAKYAARADDVVAVTSTVESRIRTLVADGLGTLDAAHLAFAEAAGCEVLVTCDDRFAHRARRTSTLIRVLTPIEYMSEIS